MTSKLNSLKNELSRLQFEGYILPSTDEFQSEFPPKYARRLEYLLDFPCSNGIIIVLKKQALFFTDGRYLYDAKTSLENDYLKVLNIKDLATIDWEDFNISKEDKIAYNPKLFSTKLISFFSKLNLNPINQELIDNIWKDKPAIQAGDIFEYDIQFSGKDAGSKIALIRKIINEKNSEGLILTAPDSICWLLNLRAQDSEYSPIILSYLYIDFDKVVLFTFDRAIPTQAEKYLVIKQFNEFESFVKKLSKKIIVPENSNIYIKNLLPSGSCIFTEDPVEKLKAQKNEIECENAKKVHVNDAIALAEFYGWLDDVLSSSNYAISEFELGEKLTYFRKKINGFLMESFPPICGFGENAAKIHYRASKDHCKKISDSGLLLIDSGGHYFGGTTDVTRTTLINNKSESINQEYKEYYTLVLKGHIALASIRFPKGIKGGNLDVLARQYLWMNRADYMHGTGHGVGNALSVHEGPGFIGLNDHKNVLKEGMIFSNEPGFYKDGQFGIRIENLQYIKKDAINENFLEFEQLTLVPYCKDLILFDKLTTDEKRYLEFYNEKIARNIVPLISNKAKKFVESNIW